MAALQSLYEHSPTLIKQIRRVALPLRLVPFRYML